MKTRVMGSIIGSMVLSMALCATGQEVTLKMSDGQIEGPFLNGPDGLYQTNATSLADGGRAVYAFTITNAGMYAIEVLVKAENAGENAVYVSIDEEPTEGMVWLIGRTAGSEKRYVSRAGANCEQEKFDLASGIHTLRLGGKSPFTYLQGVSLGKPPGTPKNFRIVKISD